MIYETLNSNCHVERADLSLRMGMRRFTRLTNAFSNKLETKCLRASFHFMTYHFVKTHGSFDPKFPRP
jgi:hypothetical protein